MADEVCPFCDVRLLAPVAGNELAFALRDRAPVTPLHTLIIPRRHIANVFEATREELQALHELALEVRSAIVREDQTVQGFNFGSNIGAVAGQVVCHAHVHLIPRRAGERSNMGFRVLVIGGTGQVGSALVRALLAAGACTQVVMVNRRTMPLSADARVRQVVLDTGAAAFASEIADLARTCSAPGEPLYAASCVGIGKGSQQWNDADIRQLEIGVVGAFARGCLAAGIERFGLLSAAGSSAQSRIRYARIMGEKEAAVRSVGFRRLAIFRPGIIAGNAHTPGLLALLGRLIPGPFGTIDQDDIGRAFVGEFLHGEDGTTILANAAMRQRARRP